MHAPRVHTLGQLTEADEDIHPQTEDPSAEPRILPQEDSLNEVRSHLHSRVPSHVYSTHQGSLHRQGGVRQAACACHQQACSTPAACRLPALLGSRPHRRQMQTPACPAAPGS